MITLHDMNRSFVPPYGYDFCSVKAEGSFLVATYARHLPFGMDGQRGCLQIVTVYLQDMGREVMRTEEEILDPVVAPKPEVKPIATRFRFWNGLLIALHGLQEMFLCLKSS